MWIGCGFIVLEPDIGTASVVLIIAVSMFAVAGLSRHCSSGGCSCLTGARSGPIFCSSRTRRSGSFPSFTRTRTCSEVGISSSSRGSGSARAGVTGLGLGHSREKWGLLPNPHTDFIFTIVGEELGLVGTLAVIALFMAFLMVAVRIAQRCSNQVYRLMAVGITTWIIVEALINIASVVGWWAVTGVPLPFFSYGGTALITELAAVGILVQHRARPLALGRPHDSRAPGHQLSAPLERPRPCEPVRPVTRGE